MENKKEERSEVLMNNVILVGIINKLTMTKRIEYIDK